MVPSEKVLRSLGIVNQKPPNITQSVSHCGREWFNIIHVKRAVLSPPLLSHNFPMVIKSRSNL